MGQNRSRSPPDRNSLAHFHACIAAWKKSARMVEIATVSLDDGERDVIVLGTSLQEKVVVVMDDQAGRRVAQGLGLSVVGSAGLLLLAKRKGLIAEVHSLFETVRHQGYWLSDAVRCLAGE
jgi:predicted nucleic acid-binding protein